MRYNPLTLLKLPTLIHINHLSKKPILRSPAILLNSPPEPYLLIHTRNIRMVIVLPQQESRFVYMWAILAGVGKLMQDADIFGLFVLVEF